MRGAGRRPLYAATKNAGKLDEFRALFAASEFEVRAFAHYRDVTEDAATYAGNAALKARALRAQLLDDGLEAAVLGDDSGLEVAALGGAPGILSARYAGDVTWSERRRKLLAEIAARHSRDRSARFVCALHFIDESGREIAVAATVEGFVAGEGAGDAGFGYDPLFVYPPAGRTFAQMTEAEKNGVSHRGRAVARLLEGIGAAQSRSPRPGGM